MAAESNLGPRTRPIQPRRSNLDLTIHLEPTAALAERVLLPGDPGRALLLAQTLLDAPAMFNHRRGLWGYTGVAADGHPLTIQSTGMGGPSAAIVIAELAELGAKRFLRVGTCGALDPALSLGELVVVTEALSDDGTSRALGATGRLMPDPDLARSLRNAGGEAIHAGPVVCTDLFYDTPPGTEERWLAEGMLAVEMESATLFALARTRGLQAATVLLVSDIVLTRERIGDEDLRAGETALGALAMRGLAVAQTPGGEELPARS